MTDGTCKKAILAVSFGTSVNETREKTIDVIEDSIRRAYPDYKLYRAWTSKMDRNFSGKVVKIIQSYTQIVNLMVWRKELF